MTSLLEDTSSLITWSEGWASVSNTTGTASASQWSNGTFHQCGASAIASAPTCQATLAFTGTGATVYGDSSNAHGRFFCGLAYPNGTVERQWWDGGSISEWGLGKVDCSISGLESGSHTLIFGQTANDCGKSGMSVDYLTFLSESNSSSGGKVWSSDFATTDPNPLLAASAVTPMPSATAISSSTSPAATLPATSPATTSPAATSPVAASGSSVNSTAIGAGVGVGGAAALALVVGAILWSRRKRQRSTAGTSASASTWGGPEKDSIIGSPSTYRSPTFSGSKTYLSSDRLSNVTPYTTYTVPEVQQEGASESPARTRSNPSVLDDPRGFSARGGAV